ncbi:MAG TPA: NAD(P)H-hydrate dehydratase [Candidatus Peribacteraceae bacterium]|nr:NAD(P)H-hydrate dehydratase [Candidatus Peribacteraceae bacterium]
MRNPDSHKGENGKVAVIGGSMHIHGAPIFSALAAESSGVDLTHVAVPQPHDIVTKMSSLNFMVFPFHGNELTKDDVGPILQMLAVMDAAVIGPGLARHPETLSAIEQIISGAPCPLVIDATALQPQTAAWVAGKQAVLTPHLGELERMQISQDDIGGLAARAHCVILLKGHVDQIAGPDGDVRIVEGGNAGLTVGGTGDALAGLTAGLIAQKMEPVEAAMLASKVIKTAGERLFEEKGFTYTTKEVIEQIPYLLHEMSAE